jgi:hypothetical protein
MSRVFMDGGSGINIIFTKTLREMSIPLSVLKASDTTFHGIVPGKAVTPLGKLSLDVVFGHESNFRKEKLDFEVVDWQSQYHAILGRPAFARFMAVPHYAYLKLKMPGPRGVITVNGSFIRSDRCDREFHKISETFGATAELAEIAMVTDKSLFPLASRSDLKDITRDFSVAGDTRTHQVHPTDASKTVRVSATLPIA